MANRPWKEKREVRSEKLPVSVLGIFDFSWMEDVFVLNS